MSLIEASEPGETCAAPRRLHLVIGLICALGLAIDLSELAMGGVLSAVFAAPPHNLSHGQLGWLVGSVYVGAIFGTPVMGIVADRMGPSRALSAATALLGATSLLAGFSRTPELLALVRLASGVALGAYLPLMVAYLTNIAPLGRQSSLVTLVCAVAGLAPPAVIWAVRALSFAKPMGLDGWQWAFVGGSIVATMTALGFLWLPEAPRWLASRGRPSEAHAVRRRFERSPELFRTQPAAPVERKDRWLHAEPSFRWRFAVVSLLFFLTPWATVSFPLVTGPILITRGFDLSGALLYIALASCGPPIGTLLSALLIDRIDRRLALIAYNGGMLLLLGLFASSSVSLGLAVALVGYGLFTSLTIPTMMVYGAEQFPAAGRSKAVTLAWSFNRIGAAAAPLILLPLVQAGREPWVMAVIALTLICAIALMASQSRLAPKA